MGWGRREISNQEKLPVLDKQEIIHHEESDQMQSPELSEA